MNPCRTVLIVEDDEDLRNTVAELLEDHGYRTASAGNGREALERLRAVAEGERPCLILLDLMMPVMNGWQFLWVKESDPALAEIPVVITSASGLTHALPGAQGVIPKPFRLDEVLGVAAQYCPGAESADRS